MVICIVSTYPHVAYIYFFEKQLSKKETTLFLLATRLRVKAEEEKQNSGSTTIGKDDILPGHLKKKMWNGSKQV